VSANPMQQRHVVVVAYLGWTLDAFDFFIMVFVLTDIAKEFGTDGTASEVGGVGRSAACGRSGCVGVNTVGGYHRACSVTEDGRVAWNWLRVSMGVCGGSL
jgi:hypothetical protein